MTTELIGQAQEVDDEAADEAVKDVETRLPDHYAHLSDRLGQSVLRATGMVGVNLRWLLAWLLVGERVDLAHCPESDLDLHVRTCMRILEKQRPGGSERLARSYGL